MFDSVMLACPECGTRNEFQSKGGECLLDTYDETNAPADVLTDVNRHSPVKCSKCGTPYEAEVTFHPVVKVLRSNGASCYGTTSERANDDETFYSTMGRILSATGDDDQSTSDE